MNVAVQGADLHYTTRGEGPACLVLSAVGTKPYEIQMPGALSARLKLVFVDLRGGGQSTGNPADLSFDLLAQDLEAIRRDLGVERIAVLGHSSLGILALEYGRHCPETVSHVITVGTPPKGDVAWGVAQSHAFFAADASEERKRILREKMAELPPDASPGQSLFAQTPMRFFDPRFDARPLLAGALVKPELLAHILGPLTVRWEVMAEPSSLRVPHFHAHGRYDYVVPYTLWDGIPSRLPDATFELFGKSGHQPFFEEPERFTQAVSEWMASRR